MGRKGNNTQEEIFAAADRLKGSGVEVTPKSLREALGGNSSWTTIYKYMDLWLAEQATKVQPVTFDQPESVRQAFNTIWHAVTVEAATEVAAIRTLADKQIKSANNLREEAVAAIAGLEAEAETDAARIEALEQLLAAAKTAGEEAAVSAAAQAARVDEMGRQIRAQTNELERVHTEHETARQAFVDEQARSTADFARQLADQAEALRQYQVDTADLRTKLEAKAQEVQQALERETGARLELTKAQGEIARCASQRDQFERELAKSTEQVAAIRSDMEDLRGRLAAVSSKNEGLTQETQSLRSELAEAGSELLAMAKRRDEATSAVAEAREQAALLQGQLGALKDQYASLLTTISPGGKKSS